MNAPQIKADFLIVTPMFLGEADQAAKSIRPQSIKGELAFWWRALHYAGYVANEEKKEKKERLDPLKTMHNDEMLLFGGAKRQAAFLLSVNGQKTVTRDSKNILLTDGNTSPRILQKPERSHPNLVGPGIRYLGFGVIHGATQRKPGENEYRLDTIIHCAGELIRPCFAPGGTFSIRLVLRRNSGAKALIPGLINALKIMGLLGGLGSRTRRGFGSIAMTGMTVEGLEAEPFVPPNDRTSYTEALKKLINVSTTPDTDFQLSAFASDTDLRIWKEPKRFALDALEAIGVEFQQYRGWGFGNPPKVAGVPSRMNFGPDHNWFKSAKTIIEETGKNIRKPDNWKMRVDPEALEANSIPERAIFGLPHNYSSKEPTMKLNVEPSGAFSRRASPLLFHIHKVGSGYWPVATFFDTQFLPDLAIKLEDASEKGDPITVEEHLVFAPNSEVIHTFLRDDDEDDKAGNRRKSSVKDNPALFTKVLP